MLTRILVATAIAATPAALLAHHGWSSYDDTRTLTVKAPLTAVTWGNPHGAAKVRWQKRTWDVVLAPPTRIQRAGLTRAAVPRGTRVTARGHRHRDPRQLEMKTERLIVGNRTFDLYPERS